MSVEKVSDGIKMRRKHMVDRLSLMIGKSLNHHAGKFIEEELQDLYVNAMREGKGSVILDVLTGKVTLKKE